MYLTPKSLNGRATRIAALENLETAAQEDPPGEEKLPKEGPAELPYVAQWTVAFLDHRVPVNVHSLQTLVSALVALAFGAQDGNLVAVLMQRAGLFPYARVKRNGEVFNNDEDLFLHQESIVVKPKSMRMDGLRNCSTSKQRAGETW
jgi:hypothetical protein